MLIFVGLRGPFHCTITNKCSAVADMGDRLSTIDMDRKLVEGAVPLWGRGTESPSNNVARDEAYLPIKWYLDPSSRLRTTGMG